MPIANPTGCGGHLLHARVIKFRKGKGRIAVTIPILPPLSISNNVLAVRGIRKVSRSMGRIPSQSSEDLDDGSGTLRSQGKALAHGLARNRHI